MISAPRPWTDQEVYQAIQVYLASVEAKKFKAIFSNKDLTTNDLAAFARDGDRRTDSTGRAGKWWSEIQACIRTDLTLYLSLVEPFAQHGLSVDDVYALLPGYFEPEALVLALRALSSPRLPTGERFPPGISNVVGWTKDQIGKRFIEMKSRVGWDRTSGAARTWWNAFEQRNAKQPELLLRVTEEIANRQSTITEFYLSFVYSETTDIFANLHYLDYTRLKKEQPRTSKDLTEVEREEEEGDLTEDEIEWWRLPSINTTRTVGWTQEKIHERIDELVPRLGPSATWSANKWWKAFEEQNLQRPGLILRLAEEMVNRRANITEFFSAYVYADTENLEAILHYLDYSRIKKEEERKITDKELAEAKKRGVKEWFDKLIPLLEGNKGLPALSENDVALLRKVVRDGIAPTHLQHRLKEEIMAAELKIARKHNRFAEVYRRITKQKVERASRLEKTAYAVKLLAITENRTGMIASITGAISDMKTGIRDARASIGLDQKGRIEVTVEVFDVKHLDKVISSVKNLQGVIDVERVKGAA